MKAIPPDLEPVMAAIAKAAQKGLPCPTNPEIMGILQRQSVSAGANAITRLEGLGFIKVVRFTAFRVVTILETGKSTARPTGQKKLFSERVKGGNEATKKARERMNYSKDQYDRDFRSPGGTYVKAFKADPSAQVVNRDPCWRCGVRADIGCEHQPASKPLTIEEAIR